MKAVENGGTAVGIRCKDGIVLAVEKIITSKLLRPGANKKISTVDRHIGVVRCYVPGYLQHASSADNHQIRCTPAWSPMVDIS